MTDIEITRQMLERAGIQYSEASAEKKGAWKELKAEYGYSGFYSLLIFRADGSLMALEAYE